MSAYNCSLGFVVSALTPEGPYTIMSRMLDLSSLFSLAVIHLPVGHFLMCVNSTGLVGVLCASIATPVVLSGLSGSKPNAATPMMSGGSWLMNCLISSSAFQSVPDSPSTSSASALISDAMVLALGIQLSPLFLCFHPFVFNVAMFSVCLEYFALCLCVGCVFWCGVGVSWFGVAVVLIGVCLMYESSCWGGGD